MPYRPPAPLPLPRKPTLVSSLLSSLRPAPTLDAWSVRAKDVAWRGILGNVGKSGVDTAIGRKDSDVAEGVVVASPSDGGVKAETGEKEPNYHYTWTRDTTLVLPVLLDKLHQSGDVEEREYLHGIVKAYLRATKKMQENENPSGGLKTGGLGEPKFMVDLSPFDGDWGRPQRDGPPLRVLFFISYAEILLAHPPGTPDALFSTASEQEAMLKALFDPASESGVVFRDVSYVLENWADEEGFDLWEELEAPTPFTLLVSRESLRRASALAKALAHPTLSAQYSTAASEVTPTLQRFISPSRPYLLSAPDPEKFGRSGLDAAVILAVLHGGGDGQWALTADRVLRTHFEVQEAFRGMWRGWSEINFGRWAGAVPIGRYPEDRYDGVEGFGETKMGNPWYICTLAFATHLYLAALHFRSNPITPTALSAHFFAQFLPSLSSSSASYDTYPPESAAHDTILRGMRTLADGYLALVQRYEGADGRLAEQFNKQGGRPRGARDLTWSYEALWGAVKARERERK